MDDWTRISAPIEKEDDRRALCAILAANGLTVRIVVEKNKSGYRKWYVEYHTSEKSRAFALLFSFPHFHFAGTLV